MHGGRARKWSYADLKSVNPRVKNALRLVTTGAVATLKEASEIAGVNRHHVSNARTRSPVVKAYVAKLERDLDAGAVNMSAVMQELGRRGVQRIAAIMEDDNVKDELRLKAAQDLADRSPETSKTNKISLEGDLTLRTMDAAALVKALLEGNEVAEEFDRQVEEGDYVKVDSEVKYLLPGAPKQSG